MSFSGGKDGFFTFYVETEKMSLQDLWSRTPVLRLFTYFEEDTLKSLFFVKWRVLKSLPPSTEQENSCLLASASCEQLHRQTPSLQLSSSVLIFTLANPYTKQNSFNCRWWASEREWTPAFLAAKNLFGICHTDEQFEFSSSICLTTIMACWAVLNTAACLWPEILSWLWEDTPCSQYFPLALSQGCCSGWALLARQDSVEENIPFLLSLSEPQNWNDNFKNCFGSDLEFQ